MLAWGERGLPGLLFLHGNGAHARWWEFIAPFLAGKFRCAAFSWGGMGGSDWRQSYAPELFVEEAIAAAEAAGLYEAGPPAVVAHSFGGIAALKLAGDRPNALRSLVVIDTPLFDDKTLADMPQLKLRPNPVYPTRTDALARFRLIPPEKKPNRFIVDHLGAHSLARRDNGWTWLFDPFLWKDMRFVPRLEMLDDLSCPFAYIYGELSELAGPELADAITSRLPAARIVAIPEAGHHVMVDQPLALVTALRALLSAGS